MNDSPARPGTEALHAAALEATELRDWPQAAALWQALATASPNDADFQLRLAEALYFAQQPAEAARVARLVARLRPKEHRPLVVLARAETTLDPAAAIAAWRGVVALAPGEFEAWARLAELQGQQGRLGPAMEALLRALALRPEHPFGLALAARLLGELPMRQRHDRLRQALAAATPDAALALLHVMAQLEPEEMMNQAALAKALLDRNAHAQALPPLRALAQANPQAPEPLADLAEALHRSQRWAEAVRNWRRLLHLRPGDPIAQLHLVQALRQGGHPAAALDAVREALTRQPDSLGLLHEQARCLALLGPAEAAEAAWAAALAAHPHDGALRLDHTDHLLRQGRPDEALAALEPLVGPAAGFDRASLLLMRLLRHRLPAEALLARFAAALAAGLPPAPDAVALEVALRGGLLLLGCGRLDAAATLLDTARAAPGAPPHLVLRAGLRLLLARGEDAAARVLAEQALATHRRQAWAWREVLRAFHERADADYATSVFRRACQVFHDRPADWLRLTAAGQRGLPAAEILARLEALAPYGHGDLAAPDGARGRVAAQGLGEMGVAAGVAGPPACMGTEEALRAARLALRQGATALATRLLGAATPPPSRQAAWQRHLALHDRVAHLPRAEGEDFATTLLRCLGSLAAATPAQAEWAAGPIVLLHDALGAGGAGRPIAATLGGLAALLQGGRPLHLLCTRLTEHPERRLHLAAVRAAGAIVTDLGGQDAPPREASGLDAEAQDLLELLGPGLATEILLLHAAFRRLRPCVVHLWHDDSALAGAIAALLAGVPRVLRVTHASRARARNPRAWQAMAASPRLALANSSAAGAAEDAAWLRLPPDRVEVLRHGFDFDILVRRAAPSAAAALRAEFQIPATAPVVGGAMRLAEAKRPLLWVAAAAALARRRPDAHFVLLGDGPLRDRVLEQARAEGIAERLHLPGRTEPAPWLRLMDVVLLASGSEGLPRTAVAAQALGRPVVAVRVGGVAETLREGITGHTVAPETPQLDLALAERLDAVLADPAWLAAARGEAPRFVGARFSLQAMAQRTLELYGLAAPLPDGALPAWLPPPGEAEREAATAAVQRRDWAAAQTQWDLLLGLLPRDEEALLGTAGARLQQNQLVEARALYGRAMREGAGPEALRGLARTLRALREDREALPLWEALLRHSARDLEAIQRCAETRARLGELATAIGVVEAGRRLLGQDARLVRLLARLHAEADNPAEALRHWNALAEALPQDAEAQLQAGLAAQAVGEAALAERRLRAALAGPAAPRAAAALVTLLAPTQPAAARAVLRQGLRLGTTEPALWRAAAQALPPVVLARALERLGTATQPAARLLLADRLLDAERPRSAATVLQALLAEPDTAAAAAERLARLALRQGDAGAAAGMAMHATLSAGVRQEIALANRFCSRLRADTGEQDPRLGLWQRVAQAAHRRGHPRYLPRRASVLHLAAAADLPLALAHGQAAAEAGTQVTVLNAEPGPAAPVSGLVRGSLADRTLAVPEALAQLPELAVPHGSFGEALRPRMVGQLAAALAAVQPATLMLWSLPLLAEAALAALAQGVPRLVLCASGPAPNLAPAPSEAGQLRLGTARLVLRAALLAGQARLWHPEAAALAGWVAWLELDPDAAARLSGTDPVAGRARA